VSSKACSDEARRASSFRYLHERLAGREVAEASGVYTYRWTKDRSWLLPRAPRRAVCIAATAICAAVADALDTVRPEAAGCGGSRSAGRTRGPRAEQNTTADVRDGCREHHHSLNEGPTTAVCRRCRQQPGVVAWRTCGAAARTLEHAATMPCGLGPCRASNQSNRTRRLTYPPIALSRTGSGAYLSSCCKGVEQRVRPVGRTGRHAVGSPYSGNARSSGRIGVACVQRLWII
jgi:hypothetical protein